MEKIVTSAVIGNQVYSNGIEQHGTAYEEFMRWRPIESVLGDAWYEIFNDAVRSLILNTESINKIGINKEQVDDIVSASSRYARLYFRTHREGDSALYIFKGVLDDVIRGYDYEDHRYDYIVNGLYDKIVALIKA